MSLSTECAAALLSLRYPSSRAKLQNTAEPLISISLNNKSSYCHLSRSNEFACAGPLTPVSVLIGNHFWCCNLFSVLPEKLDTWTGRNRLDLRVELVCWGRTRRGRTNCGEKRSSNVDK